ncbi:ankyrin [Paxillus ammoniavirescens]|nr:ankyrin [Paxillus ammoniavirescens]
MDIATSYAATIIQIARAAQQALAAGLRYAKHYRSAEGSFKQLQDDLQCVLVTANIARAALARPPSFGKDHDIDDSLVQWFSSNEPQTCLDTLSRMKGLITGPNIAENIINRTRFAVRDEDKIKDAIALFDKHRTHFRFLLNTEIWQWNDLTDKEQLQEVSRRQRDANEGSTATEIKIAGDRNEKKKVDRQEVAAFLRWLDGLDCTEKHEDTCALRQAETCTWLLETDIYRSWRRGDISFLWLEGKPGSGKSVLASSVINDLHPSDGEVLVFFYCDFRNERSTSAPEIMRSLLTQLLRLANVDDCRGAVPELAERKDRGTPPPRDMKLLTRLVRDVAKQFFRHPLIVIDALDECRDVVKLLKALVELNIGHIRLLVTSRPEQIIKKSFSGLPSISLHNMTGAVSVDMGRHITGELDSHRWLRLLEPGLKKEIRSTLLKGADGMFRWIQCQINTLSQCTSAREIRKTLKSLPFGLDETYERILLKIDEKEFQGQLVRRALVWLVAALRPLHLSDIIEALKIDPKKRTLNDDIGPMNEIILLDTCGSLVMHYEETGIVTLSHFSVKEYLTGELIRAKLPLYHINWADAHEQLARLCMCYMSLVLLDHPESVIKKNRPWFPAFPSNYVAVLQDEAHEEEFPDDEEEPFHDEENHSSCDEEFSDEGELLYGEEGPFSHEANPPFPEEESSETKRVSLTLLSYALSDGFDHLAHLGPEHSQIYDDMQALQADIERHPSKWEEIRKMVSADDKFWSPSETRSWPSSHTLNWSDPKHDFTCYILVRFAPVSLLERFLDFVVHTHKDGTNPLVYAAYFDKVQHAQILLSRGANVNSRGWVINGSYRDLPLATAVECGHAEPVDLFLEAGSRVPQRSFDIALSPRTVLPSPIIRSLLRTDKFPEWVTTCQGEQLEYWLHTVLRRICDRNEEHILIDIARRLIQVGCNPFVYNIDGKTPLHVAAAMGHVSVVEYLLTMHSWLPPDILFAAAGGLRNHSQTMRVLIDQGADVHAVQFHRSVLHVAVDHWASDEYECLRAAKLLINADCDPSVLDSNGQTPLHMAIRHGHVSVVEYLLSVYVLLPPDILLTAATAQRGHAQMMRMLIDRGANLHILTSRGESVLHLSTRNASAEDQSLQSAKALIDAGCDPSASDSNGKTPLHAVATKGHILIMEYLFSLHNPLPSDILFSAGRAWAHSAQVTQMLIDKGANVYTRTSNGDSVLHVTVNHLYHDEDQCLQTVKILIDAGCDPSMCNFGGETPLHIAANTGYVSVVEYLLPTDIPLPHDILFTAGNPRLRPARVTRMLIDKGANVHALMSNGDSVLHLTIINRDQQEGLETVKMLVDAGCDPSL